MIWVDADACPVRAEAEAVATRRKTPMTLVCNGGIRPSQNPMVETVYVGNALDAADDHIAEAAASGDVVVTDDLPLADRALKAGAAVIKPNGEELTTRNIAPKLAARNAADISRGGGLAMLEGGKGRPFTKRDRAAFSQSLDRVLTALERK
ncbi:MAG: YaiI/YqxD family protein [Pseudomonadota bacterium]